MFSLVKWYGDCVTPDGRALIGYWAELQWRGMRIRYASSLDARPEHPVQVRTTIRAGAPPALEADHYRWSEPLVRVNARWKPLAPRYTETLFKSQEGEVRWSCLAPAAEAEMSSLSGAGYLERVEMTVPPWSLPLDTLHWGRFVAADVALTWIDWRGPHHRRVVLRDGLPVVATAIERTHIVLESGERLEFDCGRTVREGTLGPNVIAAVPGLDRLVPVRLLQVHEHKWLSQAQLLRDGNVLSRGWAIHEVVSWLTPAAR